MTKSLSLLLALLICGGLAIAQAPPSTPQCYFDDSVAYSLSNQTGDENHLTGLHTFAGLMTETCNYFSYGYQYCGATATAVPSVAVSDTGYITELLGYHVGHKSTSTGTAFTPMGAVSANGTGAAAFEYCLSASCSFNVSANPLSFPSGSMRNFSQTGTAVCPAFPDPNWTQGNGYGGNSCDGDTDCPENLCCMNSVCQTCQMQGYWKKLQKTINEADHHF